MSYTNFAYSDLKLDKNSMTDADELKVELKVKNTGKVAGKEIVQLYVHKENAMISRPEKELRAFAKVDLKPGEEKTVSFNLSKRDFAFYDVSLKDWKVNSGKYEILAGGSSRNLPLKETVEITGSNANAKTLSRDSMIKEFKGNPNCPDAYGQFLMSFGYDLNAQPPKDETPQEKTEREKSERGFLAFLNDMPIRKIPAFSQGKFNDAMLEGFVQKCNQSK